MYSKELLEIAEEVLEAHRVNLLVDDFVKIELDITQGDFISNLIEGHSPMSWIIQLNPERHDSVYDVQYSVIESLMEILFDELRLVDSKENINLVKKRIIARLSAAFCNLFEEGDDLEEEFEDE